MFWAMLNSKVPEGAGGPHDEQDATPGWSMNACAPNPFELPSPPAVEEMQVLRVSWFGSFHGSGSVGGWAASTSARTLRACRRASSNQPAAVVRVEAKASRSSVSTS